MPIRRHFGNIFLLPDMKTKITLARQARKAGLHPIGDAVEHTVHVGRGLPRDLGNISQIHFVKMAQNKEFLLAGRALVCHIRSDTFGQHAIQQLGRKIVL